MRKFQAMDDFLQEHVKAGPPGCGCMVAQNGETLYENYFGYADLEKKIPITANSVYRQYSTTKVMVVTAAMLLFERGKFLLNDPISDYFPEWKNTMVALDQPDGSCVIRPVKRPIEVKDCFSMAMGIGYGGDDYTHRMMEKVRSELAAGLGDYTLRDDIRAMAQVPVRFDPGEGWMYGFGHELVAGLIEVTSGMRLSEFLQKELFEPLGMHSTGYHFFGDIQEKLVTPYLRHEDGSKEPTQAMFEERFAPQARYEAGGAGIFSSVRDYSVFAQMLANGGVYKGQRIMGRKTIDLLRANQLSDRQLQDYTGSYLEGYGYGLGVRTLIDAAKSSSTSLGEFGWTGFMGTYVSIDPSEKASVVYMHNMVPNMEEYTHCRVRNIAYGALK